MSSIAFTKQSFLLFAFFYTTDCQLPSHCISADLKSCTFDLLDASLGITCLECTVGFYVSSVTGTCHISSTCGDGITREPSTKTNVCLP